MNCELNSEPVFASLPVKKLSKTQRNRVSLQVRYIVLRWKTVRKMFSFCIFCWFQSSLTYHDICGPHWWLRSYSSQESEGYKLKAESLFLICLELLFSLYCNFWHIFDMMPGGPMSRTETKGERTRTTTSKQNTSNSSYLVEEVAPQNSFLGH